MKKLTKLEKLFHKHQWQLSIFEKHTGFDRSHTEGIYKCLVCGKKLKYEDVDGLPEQ